MSNKLLFVLVKKIRVLIKKEKLCYVYQIAFVKVIVCLLLVDFCL